MTRFHCSLSFSYHKPIICYTIMMQSFGSQEWNTGFAIQALLASNLTDEIRETIKKGHDFIKMSRVKDNPSGDFRSMY